MMNTHRTACLIGTNSNMDILRLGCLLSPGCFTHQLDGPTTMTTQFRIREILTIVLQYVQHQQTPQQNLSSTSYPYVHYNSKHPPATGGMPTPNCYRKSDNFMRHPTAVGPDYLQKQENKRPTYPQIDEAPLAFKPAADSGEHPVTNYPPTYEASHHSWYQQLSPIIYGTTGPSMSPTAYGDVMDGSIHFMPGYVQYRPPQVRLQSYNNTTVGGLPDYFIPSGSTRRPGKMNNVKSK